MSGAVAPSVGVAPDDRGSASGARASLRKSPSLPGAEEEEHSMPTVSVRYIVEDVDARDQMTEGAVRLPSMCIADLVLRAVAVDG